MKKFVFWFFISLIVTFTLISCDGNRNTGIDGYYFEQESMIRTSFTTDIVLVKDFAELKKVYVARGGKDVDDLAAFTLLSQTENKCTIFMVDPKNNYEPEYIGHELVHCIYGEWHKSQ